MGFRHTDAVQCGAQGTGWAGPLCCWVCQLRLWLPGHGATSLKGPSLGLTHAVLLQGDMTEALRSMDAGMAAAEAELKLASTALPVMGPPGPGLARTPSAVPTAAQQQATAVAQKPDAHGWGVPQACNGSDAAPLRAQQQPAAADGSGSEGAGGGSSAAAAQAPVQQRQQAAEAAVRSEDAPTQPQQQAGPGMQLTPEARWGATEGHFAEMLQNFLVSSAGCV